MHIQITCKESGNAIAVILDADLLPCRSTDKAHMALETHFDSEVLLNRKQIESLMKECYEPQTIEIEIDSIKYEILIQECWIY